MIVKFFNQVNWLLCNPLHLFFVHKLEELGYEVIIVNSIEKDDESLYFITFANFNNLPKNYILYNFEYSDFHLKNENNIDMYNGAIEVWDYSRLNIENMKLRTVHKFVPYLPKQYEDIREAMKLHISEQRRIKNLFYGCSNSRRNELLNGISSILQQKGEHLIKIGHGYEQTFFGLNLWKILGSTETVFNIHYYMTNPSVLEIYRISECELLGVNVISEPGYVDPEYEFTNLTIVDDFESYLRSH